MSRKSRAIKFPLLKRREPSRDRAQVGSNALDLMAIGISKRSKVGSSAQILAIKTKSTIIAKISKNQKDKNNKHRTLLFPRLVRR